MPVTTWAESTPASPNTTTRVSELQYLGAARWTLHRLAREGDYLAELLLLVASASDGVVAQQSVVSREKQEGCAAGVLVEIGSCCGLHRKALGDGWSCMQGLLP
jgi:hypothetical protein